MVSTCKRNSGLLSGWLQFHLDAKTEDLRSQGTAPFFESWRQQMVAEPHLYPTLFPPTFASDIQTCPSYNVQIKTENYISQDFFYPSLHLWISHMKGIGVPMETLTFFSFLFSIGVELINNVVLTSGIQQSDSDIHINVSILFQIFFPFKLLHNMEQSSCAIQ